MMINIPESYRDYLTDRAIQSVVDHLLEQKDDALPAELEWDEVHSYHSAWLSAQKVKTDYALLLLELWAVIWKPSLEKHGISSIHAYSIEDMKEYDAEPSRRALWDDGVFYRWFTYTSNDASFEVETKISISDENIRLHLKIENEAEEYITDELELSELWEKEEDDGYIYLSTRNKLASLTQCTDRLDISELIQLADEAISAFIKYAQE